MKNRRPTESDIARLESVLRSAAAFDPGSPAPTGFASRALARNPARHSSRRAAYGIAFAISTGCAALAAAAILIKMDHNEAAASRSAPLKTAAYPPPNTKTPEPAPEKQKPTLDQIKITDAFEKRRVRPKTKKPGFRSVRPGKPQRAVVAKAELHEEVVHRFESGVIAPVMIATPDAESGETVLQTSLLKLPIEHGEYIEKSDYDSSHIRPVSNEEN